MEDAHRQLRITADEWRAFLDDLRQTLDRFDVPARERRELVAIVESTHEAIVGQALVDGAAARAGAAVS
jgi:truncated hemoglobin YjbI